MMRRSVLVPAALVSLAALLACGSDDAPSAPSGAPVTPASSPTPAAPAPDPPSCTTSSCAPAPPPEPAPPLRVLFLGVDGFLLERGDDAVLTAPLFTRPSMVTASTGIPVTSDAALVAKGLPSSATSKLRAILAGHAHYDHLLDVPEVMSLAPQAALYANVSARNLLAAFAPDRAAKCAGTEAEPKTIARSRVIAVDDPAASTVDYTNCPEKRPPGAPLQGSWMKVPGANVRVLAMCSEHPDQIGPVHYGAGDVTEEKCTRETNMNEWREGRTVSYLVDFLDPKSGAPVYRVFYEDAPAESPIGHVPAAFLAEKRVDLALMCVGTYDRVDDASPAKALAALHPRYAIGGHWEDFFRGAGEVPQPIPFLDVAAWETKARASLPNAGESTPLLRNGSASTYRAVLPQPGDTFAIR